RRRRRRARIRLRQSPTRNEAREQHMNPEVTGLRTHMCGALRENDAGSRVRLGGWVHRTRNLGGLVFVDLRDRSGIVQVSFDPNRSPADAVRIAAALGNESVVLV